MANSMNPEMGTALTNSFVQFAKSRGFQSYNLGTFELPGSRKPGAFAYTVVDQDGDYAELRLVYGLTADKEKRFMAFALVDKNTDWTPFSYSVQCPVSTQATESAFCLAVAMGDELVQRLCEELTDEEAGIVYTAKRDDVFKTSLPKAPAQPKPKKGKSAKTLTPSMPEGVDTDAGDEDEE